MKLAKCPKCELNYIREGETYCEVCKRANKKKAEHEETLDICPECNENPVVPGRDLCKFCLMEKKKLDDIDRSGLEDDRDGIVIDDVEDLDGISMDEVAEMEEIDIVEPDIPDVELSDIDRELGRDEEGEGESFDELDEEEDETLE